MRYSTEGLCAIYHLSLSWWCGMVLRRFNTHLSLVLALGQSSYAIYYVITPPTETWLLCLKRRCNGWLKSLNDLGLYPLVGTSIPHAVNRGHMPAIGTGIPGLFACGSVPVCSFGWRKTRIQWYWRVSCSYPFSSYHAGHFDHSMRIWGLHEVVP